ncbi:MAG: calcium/proton exchanger [Armatimonadetes bacterium]|nr:calcium/proton exchanger [Armatimonadota bacterium]
MRRAILIAVGLSVLAQLLILLQAPVLLCFILAGASLIAIGGVLADTLQDLSGHVGPVASGLLNATFGNSVELIIGFMALSKGLVEVVKATITGSIITNLLLVLGLAAVAGGLRHKQLQFSAIGALQTIGTMTVVVMGLMIPSMFVLLPHPEARAPLSVELDELSLAVSAILMFLYFLGLLFSLHTHRDILSPLAVEGQEPEMSLRSAGLILLGATSLVALQSEALLSMFERLAARVPLTPTFMGVIVLASVGNAADYAVAIRMARNNQMEVVFQIVSNAATQIALFVAPLLVFVGLAMGQPMDLAFSLLEVLAVALATLAMAIQSADGRLNWFEGAQLLSVYGLLAVTFLFY